MSPDLVLFLVQASPNFRKAVNDMDAEFAYDAPLERGMDRLNTMAAQAGILFDDNDGA